MRQRQLNDAEYRQAGAIARHVYETQSRNGYTGVDVYVDGRLMRGPVFTGTRKVAESVAGELAEAYEAGLRDAIVALNDARTGGGSLAEDGLV